MSSTYLLGQRNRGRAARLFLSLASLLVSLLVIEVVFRTFDIRGYHEPRTRPWAHALVPDQDRVSGVRIQFKPYSHFEFGYDSNPRGYFNEDNALTYRMNRHGFRGPDYGMAKPSEATRVIVLGDSFTFGEGVRFEHTFTSLMGTLLGDQLGFPVELLNFGVSGWGTADEINYLKQAGVEFEPDLVVVAYVLNDADYAGGLDLWDNFRNLYEKRRLRHSYLASFAYATVAQHIYSRKYVEEMTLSALAQRGCPLRC